MKSLRCFAVLVGLLFCTTGVRAEDWPTYMHDNARSGVTANAVQLPLKEQWFYSAPQAPRPAWPPPQVGWTELPKVDFDDAFYTVADKETVYFGSSVDQHIHAALNFVDDDVGEFAAGAGVFYFRNTQQADRFFNVHSANGHRHHCACRF